MTTLSPDSPDAADAASQLGGNLPDYSVSDLAGSIRKTLETQFGRIRLRGEVTELLVARSGHVYMSLKDENAKIRAVCWKGVASRLKFKPEDGLEIVAVGKVSSYAPRSEYQFVIEDMAPAGAGALMALLEERRRKLLAEGLFEADRKQHIPYLPHVIGVVTSPTGAVIRDILHRLRDRFPRHVILWPVQVQGDGAAQQIAAAIEGFNKLQPDSNVPRPDVLIVARGGGSLEDLWAFNEEIVVRAAAASDIPLISAVGHETDTTLIDFASDLRAPTPTAAAEMAVPVRAELLADVKNFDRRLGQAVLRQLADQRKHVDALARALPRPLDLLSLARQRQDDLAERLPRALTATTRLHRQALLEVAGGLRPGVIRSGVTEKARQTTQLSARIPPAWQRIYRQKQDRLAAAGRLLDSLSYQNVLRRGFALVHDADGKPILKAAGLAAGDALTIEFQDGKRTARVEDDGSSPPAPKKQAAAEKAAARKAAGKTARKSPSGTSKDQGSLF